MRKLLSICSVITLLLVFSVNAYSAELNTYGPTSATDQLWLIAQKVRPNLEVSKQQTMVAILKANPRAFAANNVNGLRAGYTLTIPSLNQIKSISALSALIQISAQNTAWKNRVELAPLPENIAYTRFQAKPEQSSSLQNSLADSPENFLTTLFTENSDQPMSFSDTSHLQGSTLLSAVTIEKMIKQGIALQLSRFSQGLEDFINKFSALEKETTQKLQLISEDQAAMKNQIASLDKQVQQLRENYLNLSAPIQGQLAIYGYGFWVFGLSILASLLVFMFRNPRRREVAVQIKESPTVSLKDTIEAIEDEYDYMGSQEGIAAKLDLARAYIDMGDTSQATQILNDVLLQGNQEQRAMAEKILSEITRDTVH